MDYLGIVINGYFDKNNRSFLLEYFFSEYKKAEKEHYGASRFFEGCLGVIEPWELYIKSKVFDRVNELHIVIEAAKSGRLSFADLGGKTIEQKTIEAIKHYEQELENVRQDGVGDTTFTAHLASLTNGRIFYNISYPEILQIKKAIMLAREKAITPDPLPPEQTETKTEHETIEMKPVLKPEVVQIVFDIIKDFFSTEQQTELKLILESGNKASNKLLFKGAGNRLTDTFKKLFEYNFITGCQKKDLINWIISNFKYIQQNKVKEFVFDTIEKTISRNNYPCKSPLIEIKNGQIQKVTQPRIKEYNKY